jgi:hypothetical protein
LKSNILGEKVNFKEEKKGELRTFSLSNDLLKIYIVLYKGKIKSERIGVKEKWVDKFGSLPSETEMDGDFSIEIIWEGWRAPGKVNNADNLIILSKEDFRIKDYFLKESNDGSVRLNLIFKGEKNPFEIKMIYELKPQKFYFKRKLAIRNLDKNFHFIHWFWSRYGYIDGELTIVKSGGFGQPVAIKFGDLGVFLGLEYPAGENYLTLVNNRILLKCGQEFGIKMDKSWIETEWVVCGISPNSKIKYWFFKYIDDIRVAPLKPYLLYNSWYDLRAPEMIKNSSRAMTEENVLRTIDFFRKRLYEKEGISLNAFVLDDGWDVYLSDWVLNKKQFPRDLIPITTALKEMNTALGIWISPIGGYSHRGWRVNWMKEHGYETVGDQMCVGGKNYWKLLVKRLRDFIRQYDVSYFKIDGIQFICNEEGHGHLPGIYSRRSIMEAVIKLCKILRSDKPEIFLNITSGTWLSPWWLKYANTIWMQGYDYGYANVPSIHRRDRAMTYRDSVLFDDFKKEEFWFPMANLMTHGIIKGHLNPFEGEKESIEKFTDNAVLYFARGISMWELYISPDLLTSKQWEVLVKAIKWAKNKFKILINTEMVGGDPEKRNAYGYVHYSDGKAIIAVRNPFIEPQIIRIKLSDFFDLRAEKLVLEKIYPVHWISPQLYSRTSTLNIFLDGYETAIYQVYSVEKAEYPLFAGCIYYLQKKNEKEFTLECYRGEREAKLLNPKNFKTAIHRGKKISPDELRIPPTPPVKSVKNVLFSFSKEKGKLNLKINFVIEKSAKDVVFALLVEPTGKSIGSKLPVLNIFLGSEKIRADVKSQKGRWAWNSIKIAPGKYNFKIDVFLPEDLTEWKGLISAWLIYREKLKKLEFTIISKKSWKELKDKKIIFPPTPYPKGEIKRNFKIKTIKVALKK